MPEAMTSNLPALYHQPEQGILQVADERTDTDGLLRRLLQFYDASEEASHIARERSERDRDYVDNKQLTDEEMRALAKRGQPAIIFNVVRSRAAFLAGMEKKQRRDPKAYPRNNPEDVGAAEAFTDGMRYVVSTADYPSKRSQAWKNITVEGFGGIEIAAVPKADGDVEFTMNRIPWDRLFYDPHSAEPDFSDARFVGQVMWMDYDEAVDRAVKGGYVTQEEAEEVLEATLSTAPGMGRTYDDKPKWTIWADGKRKRVRIVMMWHKEPSGWEYCEFTKGGVLACSVGAYVDQDGETYCPWILESANVDRENNRYGELRNLIDPQDEVNKRRSKGLHLLTTRGVIADDGAVNDVNAARRELAKPDYWLVKNRGADLQVQDGAELALGQAQMGAEAMAYIREAGPNQALLGKGTQDQSGKAIEAQQAGGLVEQSDLMDTLRRLDLRVFTVIASMMKQFWTRQKWIRVTDNDEAPQWVGLNEPMWTDPMSGHTAPDREWQDHFTQGGNPQDPGQIHRLQPAVDAETGEPQLNNHVARLNMDIIVSDAPDTITLDNDNYQAFLQLMGLKLPPAQLKIAIEMNPGLNAKRKKLLQDLIDQAAQAPPPAGEQNDMRLKVEKVEAEIVAIRAAAYASLGAGEAALAKAGHGVPYVPPVPDVSEGFGQPAPQMPPEAPPAPVMPPGPPQMIHAPTPPSGPPQGPPPGPGGPPGPPAHMAGPMTTRPPMVA